MPQEQHVVRCYACKKFQVQIVKKVPKWQCKVCTAKQSVVKVYAQGSGKECRQHVQDLNMQQGLMSEQIPETPHYETTSHFEDEPFTGSPVVKNNVSKWSEYLDNTGPSQASSNSWEEEETSDTIPRTNTCMGRKRKLSNQDDFEDFSSYDQSWQTEPEVLDLSSGLCASDILKSVPVKQANTKPPVPPQPEYSGFMSSKSKWSEFVSPRDEDPMSSDDNPEALWNKSGKQQFNGTANSNSNFIARSPLVNHNAVDNRYNECTTYGYDLSSKREASASVKNPFCTVNDDENLDTLLDF